MLLELLQILVLCIGSTGIGRAVQAVGLPCISGYIFTGIIFGPHTLRLVGDVVVEKMGFVEQIGLAVIGFAAGTELSLKLLRNHGRSIFLTLAAIIPLTWLGLYATASLWVHTVPIFADFTSREQWAAMLLISTILMARSPASAISVAKECNAAGPFTTLSVCASIALDTIVVSSFTVNTQVAHSIAEGHSFDFLAVSKPVLKLISSAGLGATAYFIMSRTIARANPAVRTGILLCVGYSLFVISGIIRSLEGVLRVDPLLACVACGVFFTNLSSSANDFASLVESVLPITNVAFFTLVGCAVPYSGLSSLLHVVLSLVAVRITGLSLGAAVGGAAAGLPSDQHCIRWMGFVTQAGVAFGLCKQAALEFPTWGRAVQTVCVSCILCNLLIGPPCFKYALLKVGEGGNGEAAPPEEATPSVHVVEEPLPSETG